jgi:hypothetical protein
MKAREKYMKEDVFATIGAGRRHSTPKTGKYSQDLQ